MMNPYVLCVSVLCLAGCSFADLLKTITMDTALSTIQVDSSFWGTSSSGILKSHSGFSYTTSRNKTLNFYAAFGNGLLASIRTLDLRPNCQDKLTVFDWKYTNNRQTFCNMWSIPSKSEDIDEGKTFYASSGNLGVTFETNRGSSYGYKGFQLTYTSISNQPCGSLEFRCNNGRCISETLKCDGHNHCGDNSDQLYCNDNRGRKSYNPTINPGKVIGIVFAVVFLLIAIVCGAYIKIRRRMYRNEEGIVVINPSLGRTITTTHPPSYPPSYPTSQPSGYPPPPPPYSQYPQGQSNPGFR